MSSYASQQPTSTQTPGQSYGGDQLLQQLLGDPGRLDAVITAVLGDPNRVFRLVPQLFGYLSSWIEQSGIQIPASQIPGFSQYLAQFNQVSTEQTTTSTSFTDIGTTGPSLSGLPDGQYLLIWGATLKTSTTAQAALMGLQVNATGASAAEAVTSKAADYTSGVYGTTKTLSNGGNNSLTAKYEIGGAGTASFLNRWLLALRFANS